jgi:anti-sigma factor RsiW
MKCKAVADLMSDYVSGSLRKDTQAEIETHLAGCPSCRSEAAAARDLAASLSSLGGQKVPVDLWEGVYARIQGGQEVRRAWWRWILRPMVAAPTAVLAALVAAALLWPSGNAPTDNSLGREYTYYIGSHWRLQRQQAFVDPDVFLVRAELQKSVLAESAGVR